MNNNLFVQQNNKRTRAKKQDKQKILVAWTELNANRQTPYQTDGKVTWTAHKGFMKY